MQLLHLNQKSLFSADRVMDDFLKSDDICFTIQKEIKPLINISDFEGMYQEGGRPPVSPRRVILVLIMQYIERLSDRAAAANLRYRIDWKIAFDLELEFAGIHPTTLVYFRERLLANDRASYAFDKVLEHLGSVGLVKKNAKQRIDSTHVIGLVRELSRIELLHETLRVFCSDIEPYKSQLSSSVLCDQLEYYSDKISIRGISDAQKERYISEAGQAMQSFIIWGESIKDLPIKDLASFKTLMTVFKQNFVNEDGEPPEPTKPVKLKKVATGKGHISSPHEPEARYATKGKKEWLGYKAQVAETTSDDPEDINFITFIDVNDATDYDGDVVQDFIGDQKDRDILPAIVYGDTHYNSSDNITDAALKGVELKGPVAPVPAEKSNAKNVGFTTDLNENAVTCPQEKQANITSQWNDGRVRATFAKEACNDCNQIDTCAPEPKGKIVVVRPESDLLKQRRALMETSEFKVEMHRRNGIEGTLSGLVRGQGLRRSRHRGKNKLQLQLKFTGAAANILRLHRQRQMEVAVAA
jgi:transposase